MLKRALRFSSPKSCGPPNDVVSFFGSRLKKSADPRIDVCGCVVRRRDGGHAAGAALLQAPRRAHRRHHEHRRQHHLPRVALRRAHQRRPRDRRRQHKGQWGHGEIASRENRVPNSRAQGQSRRRLTLRHYSSVVFGIFRAVLCAVVIGTVICDSVL